MEMGANGPQRRGVIREPSEEIEMDDTGCEKVDAAEPVPHAVEFGGIRCGDFGERAHEGERIRHRASEVQPRKSLEAGIASRKCR